MFEILYQDEIGKRWTSDYLFETLSDAKEYLKNKGFTENNRIFERENYNWSTYTKALITHKDIFGGQSTCR